MSDEDIKEKITSKKRDLSREEELERGIPGIPEYLEYHYSEV